MTTDQFRQNPAYTGAMRALLADPIMQLAMEALKDSNPPIDPDPGAPEIESVRFLSQFCGYNEYAVQMRLLGEPLIKPVELKAEFQPEE